MLEKVKYYVKKTGNAIGEYCSEHDREIYGFTTAIEVLWPWALTGAVVTLAMITKKPDKYLSKDFIKVIIENHKEEG